MRKLLCLILFASFTYKKESGKPEPFMPELFAGLPNVRDLAFSPAGDELYFTAESLKKEFSVIMYSKRINSKWRAPEVVSFSGQYRDLEPALSPDGLTMFFASVRPVQKDSINPKDVDIWMVKRATLTSRWQKPERLDNVVNTTRDEYYPCVTNSGNLYFTRYSDSSNRKEDIYLARIIHNGSQTEYAAPIALPISINTNYYEYNAYVSPDETFIIFSSYGRKDDLGGSDLYISFKQDSVWTNTVNLGQVINSNKIDYCPYVDVRNRVLYFTSERSSVAKFYTSPQKKNALLNDFSQWQNGSSRIYKIPFNPEDFRAAK